ncbi:MAG: SulP family inorganic anion transporter [Sphaerochaetaceae bacterium]
MIAQYIADLKREFHGYSAKGVVKDFLASLNVAAVALPLSLAFAIASGLEGAAGLITAIIAGFVIGLLGGSSFSISGPSGAMVAVLFPIASRFGVEGVLLTGFLSGIILIIASLFKASRVVSIIPSPVITGFTSGIALHIAFGQLDNFFGASSQGITMWEKISYYFANGFAIRWQPLFFGLLVVLIMIFWPKSWARTLPGSLAGIIIALILNIILPFNVSEVGQIKRTLLLPHHLTFSMLHWANIKTFIMPAIGLALLAMITSLLCGAAGSKLNGEQMNGERELLAQGVGNIIFPFLGGVAGCAAVARSIVAIKTGGKTRLVSVFHSIVLLAAIILLGSLIAHIPLAALAGVLMVTAWRMNDWKSIKRSLHKRYKTSIAQFLVTILATVVFNLTVAVVIGVALAMVLFVLRSASLEITVANIDSRHELGRNLTQELTDTRLVYVTGQLFFGSRDSFVKTVENIEGSSRIILSLRGVPSIDHSAMLALENLFERLKNRGITVIFCGLQSQVAHQFQRSGFTDVPIYANAVEAIDSIPLDTFNL